MQKSTSKPVASKCFTPMGANTCRRHAQVRLDEAGALAATTAHARAPRGRRQEGPVVLLVGQAVDLLVLAVRGGEDAEQFGEMPVPMGRQSIVCRGRVGGRRVCCIRCNDSTCTHASATMIFVIT